LAGERPALPSDTPPEFKTVIEQCWHSNPSVRPTFSQTVTTLLQLAKSRSINVDIVESIKSDTPIAKSGKPINWHNALELISAASSLNISSSTDASPNGSKSKESSVSSQSGDNVNSPQVTR